MTDTQRERLRDFFGTTFHQDWHLDAASPEEAIRRYAAENLNSTTTMELTEAIYRFIDDHPDGAELEASLFKELYCYYWPPGAGISTRDWLRWVVGILATIA